MWEPRRLTTLWACYKDSFTFYSGSTFRRKCKFVLYLIKILAIALEIYVYCAINIKRNGKKLKLSLIATNGEKRNTDVEAMGKYVKIMSEVFHSLRHIRISYFTYTKFRKVDQFTSLDARILVTSKSYSRSPQSRKLEVVNVRNNLRIMNQPLSQSFKESVGDMA
jgi:hypothetical protein